MECVVSVHSTTSNGGEPLVVSPRRAQELLDIRTTKLYELIGSGELQSYVDGRHRKIIYASIKAYVAEKAGRTPQRTASENQPAA
jgi:excisionase family DNA binding protein